MEDEMRVVLLKTIDWHVAAEVKVRETESRENGEVRLGSSCREIR